MKFSFRKKDNTDAIEHGVWVSLDDEVYGNRLVIDEPGEGPAIRVASIQSRLYTNAYDRVTRKSQDVIRSQNWVPPDLRKAAQRAGLVAAITDWRIRDEDGKAVPFSREEVTNLLNNQLEIAERLELVAGNLARYQEEEEKADAENLPSTSSTHWNGRGTPETASPGPTSLN